MTYNRILLILILQLLVLAIFIAGFTLYLHNLELDKKKQNISNVKSSLTNILDEHINYINLIEDKISRTHSFQEIQGLIAFYYQAFKMSKNASFMEDVFFLFGNGKVEIINQQGAVSDFLVPVEKLNILTKDSATSVNFILERDSLYIAKALPKPSKNKQYSYVIAKLNLLELITYISYKETHKQKFSIITQADLPINNQKDLLYVPVKNRLFIASQNLNYTVILTNHIFVVSVATIFLFWAIASFIWVIAMLKQRTHNIEVCSILSERTIKQEGQILELQIKLNNLEHSSKFKFELYEALLRSLPNDLLFIETTKEDRDLSVPIDNQNTNIIDIIQRCIIILTPALNKQNISIEKQYSASDYVLDVNAIGLELLLSNLLFQSILRTPKHGVVILHLYSVKSAVYLTIEDRGYNTKEFLNLPEHPKNIYNLPKEILLKLSSIFKIKLLFSYKNGFKVKLKLGANSNDQLNVQSNNLRGLSNVVPFPKN